MKKINEYIDHTNLRLDATIADIEKLCSEAIEHQFPAVCISPNHVRVAVSLLKDQNVNVCTVIGFPNGYQTTETKIIEMKEMIRLGAKELDVVLNLQDVANKDFIKIENELRELRRIAGTNIIKLIIEASLLKKNEIETICNIGCNEKIDYIKTSTGFNGKARLKDVAIMKKAINGRALIKAAGGIRSYDVAMEYVKAGATRLGTSSGLKIIEQQPKD